MSVLIRGMEPSTRCLGCKFELYGQYCVLLGSYTNDTRATGRLDNCPVVGLPEKHGDLIDRDTTMKQWGLDKATKYGNETAEQQHFSYSTMMMYEIADILDDAPVVIEAEGEG